MSPSPSPRRAPTSDKLTANARILPGAAPAGVTPDDVLGARHWAFQPRSARLVRGRASSSGSAGTGRDEKTGRDRIRPDITPADDCVSESLDTLDERWKAARFRYLMPTFSCARARRGEVVIAGDRFAIGSSREMSPAGLKAVADEAGVSW